MRSRTVRRETPWVIIAVLQYHFSRLVFLPQGMPMFDEQGRAVFLPRGVYLGSTRVHVHKGRIQRSFFIGRYFVAHAFWETLRRDGYARFLDNQDHFVLYVQRDRRLRVSRASSEEAPIGVRELHLGEGIYRMWSVEDPTDSSSDTEHREPWFVLSRMGSVFGFPQATLEAEGRLISSSTMKSQASA